MELNRTVARILQAQGKAVETIALTLVGNTMAFSNQEFYSVEKEVEAFVESIRPSARNRSEFDIYYQINDQTIEIGEVRSVWQNQPDETFEVPSVKIIYIRNRQVWKILWMRKTFKCEATFYSLNDALDVVKQGCRAYFSPTHK